MVIDGDIHGVFINEYLMPHPVQTPGSPRFAMLHWYDIIHLSMNDQGWRFDLQDAPTIGMWCHPCHQQQSRDKETLNIDTCRLWIMAEIVFQLPHRTSYFPTSSTAQTFSKKSSVSRSARLPSWARKYDEMKWRWRTNNEHKMNTTYLDHYWPIFINSVSILSRF